LIELIAGDDDKQLIIPREVSTCLVRDFNNETKKQIYFEEISNIEIAYPVAIAITPYASKREIIDFVEKGYKTMIEPLQKKYGFSASKMGKIKKRKKHIQDRNDFIYENRRLPRRKIMEMVTDKFPKLDPIDYAYVSKIISNEKKRRKEA